MNYYGKLIIYVGSDLDLKEVFSRTFAQTE